MKHYLYMSLRHSKATGMNRMYCLFPCSCLADMVNVLEKNKRNIIDANLLYGDEIASWESDSHCEHLDISLTENLLISGIKTANRHFCARQNGTCVNDSEARRIFLARCIYEFVPCSTTICGSAIIETISLIKSLSPCEAHVHMTKTALTMCDMNYFDVDFEYDGLTKFIGVACVIPISKKKIDRSPFLCIETYRGPNEMPMPLDDRNFVELIQDLTIVNDNRRRKGMVFLPI